MMRYWTSAHTVEAGNVPNQKRYVKDLLRVDKEFRTYGARRPARVQVWKPCFFLYDSTL
jgi:hypothetical protein